MAETEYETLLDLDVVRRGDGNLGVSRCLATGPLTTFQKKCAKPSASFPG